MWIIEDNHGRFGFGLYSPRVTRSTSNLSTASSSPRHSSYDSHEQLSDIYPLEDVENMAEPWAYTVPPRKCSVPREAPLEIRSFKERRTSFGKENLLNSPLGSAEASPKHEPVPRVMKTFDVYAFEPSEAGPSAGVRPSKRVCTSLHFPSYKRRYESSTSITSSTNTAESNTDINLMHMESSDNIEIPGKSNGKILG